VEEKAPEPATACTWKSSFMRSSGAVAVRASAPALPPARNMRAASGAPLPPLRPALLDGAPAAAAAAAGGGMPGAGRSGRRAARDRSAAAALAAGTGGCLRCATQMGVAQGSPRPIVCVSVC